MFALHHLPFLFYIWDKDGSKMDVEAEAGGWLEEFGNVSTSRTQVLLEAKKRWNNANMIRGGEEVCLWGIAI